jgi:NOL1/NOP2/sun family putative RNA methylase
MLPPTFLDRMRSQLGNDFESFLSSYNEPPSIGLRVNTLKLDPDQFSSISPYPLTPIPWSSAGFTLPDEFRPGKHPYHAAGLYYLQDPSAMAVTTLLDPQPGEKVLDLAAAPGGKTTHIAAKMCNRGILVANDIHPQRVRILSNNVERWGARNVLITCETPEKLADHFGAYFDKVLVDAPCSGEGMFRKDHTARQEWSQKLVERCAVRQDMILVAAARLVRPGGRLVYATCTFAAEENEGTIQRFLDNQPDFEVVSNHVYPGFLPGNPDWISGEASPALTQTVRIWPHKAPGEGHFIAVLRRKSIGTPTLPGPGNFNLSPLSSESQLYFDKFAAATLTWRPSKESLSEQGTYLYHLPEGMPEIHGLRVIHWGWWLGTFKKNRFEPSYALVMAIKSGDVHQEYSLKSDDVQTMKYLHGEVLPSEGENGWTMISVDGYPLGWAKRVQNRLKSHAPKWMRWI